MEKEMEKEKELLDGTSAGGESGQTDAPREEEVLSPDEATQTTSEDATQAEEAEQGNGSPDTETPDAVSEATSASRKEEREEEDEKEEQALKKKKRKRLFIGIAAALILACGGGGAYYAYARGLFLPEPNLVLVDSGVIARGVTMEGIDLGGKTPEEANALLTPVIEERLAETPFQVVISDRTEALSLSAMGIVIDGDKAVEEAMAVGRTGSLSHRQTQSQGGTTILTLKEQADTPAIVNALTAYCDAIDREPSKEDVLFKPETLERFVFGERKDGFVPDTAAFLQLALPLIQNGTYEKVTMPGQAVAAQGEKTDVIANTVLVKKFSTPLRSKGANRTYNIRYGLGLLNGNVIQPGETYSINKVLGPRTSSRIWKMAPAISGGRMVDSLGGGICQISSTLFNAVFMSDLEIVEWNLHSMPSAYANYGEDATIADGVFDFKFKNNTDWPVYLVGYIENESQVTVEVWGRPVANGGSIGIKGVRVGTIPQPAAVTVSNPADVSGGRAGSRSNTYKIWYDQNGKEIKREMVKVHTYAATAARVLKQATPATPSPSPGTPGEGGTTPPPTTTPAPPPVTTPPPKPPAVTPPPTTPAP